MIKSLVTPIQVEQSFKKLPIKERAKLLAKLERENLKQRFEEIYKETDKRVKKYPITQEEINEVVDQVREELYGKRRKNRG